MFLFSLDVVEEELLVNLEDIFLPVRSLTPSKQSSGAVASPSARSVGSAKSSASRSTSPNSDKQRLAGLLKASSVGVIPQPAGSTGGGDTVSTSEVSDSVAHTWVDSSLPRVSRKETIESSSPPCTESLLTCLLWDVHKNYYSLRKAEPLLATASISTNLSLRMGF